MGRASKEPIKITKSTKRALVEGVDYYIKRVKNGETSPGGWAYCATARAQLTQAKIRAILDDLKAGRRRLHPPTVHDAWYSTFGHYLVPGIRPDPKWGPVGP